MANPAAPVQAQDMAGQDAFVQETLDAMLADPLPICLALTSYLILLSFYIISITLITSITLGCGALID